MNEAEVRRFLQELLVDVPLARGQGNPHRLLAALLRAALFSPVFPNWPSPVPEWLAEAEALGGEAGDDESRALLRLRRAVVKMRQNEPDAALAELDAVRAAGGGLPPRVRRWEAATRSRVHTRRQEFDLAARAADEAQAVPVPDDDWIAPLAALARAELQLERNEVQAAATSLRAVRKRLSPELLEEQVQSLQLLGFVHITLVQPREAFRRLDEAREILRGAGAWPEAVQMDLVTGNFLLSFGRTQEAESRLAEALEICRQHPQPQLEPVLQLGVSRARAARGEIAQAADAAVQAAALFARQGNALGFVAMISHLHGVHLQAGDHREAYRVLTLGLSLARRLGLALAQSLFRTQVNQMRDEILGPERFDDMVRQMLDEPGSGS